MAPILLKTKIRKGKYARKTQLIVILAVALIGTMALTLSHALTPSASVEPEQVPISGNGCGVQDVTASGGGAVKFGCGGTGGGDNTGPTAKRAYDFGNAIGINVHMAEASYTDVNQVLQDLQYVGISYVRNNDYAASSVARRQTLAAAGIKFEYPTPKASGTAGTVPTSAAIHTTIDNRINDIKNNNLQGSTSGVEGLNEYDSGLYTQPGWVASYLDAQQYLFTQMRANFGTSIPVHNVTLQGINLESTAQLVGDISSQIDVGDFHTYPGTNAPDSSLPDSQTSFVSSTPCAQLTSNQNIDDRLAILTTCMTKNKPVIASETGYENYLQSSAKNFVSAAASGTYIPRALLDNFRIGVQRTYVYQLLNQPEKGPGVQEHFGVYYDPTTPKPAATMLHGLTSLLKDTATTAASFTPGKLDYTVSGANTVNLHKVLMQKADGTFWLALWQSDKVWDNTNQVDIPPVTKNVTLTLGTTALQVTQYALDDPTNGTNKGGGKTFTISTGPDVTILQIAR